MFVVAVGGLPRWRCRKEVLAVKIARIEFVERDGTALIQPAEVGVASFWVGAEYVRRHHPEAGGYYVRHDDGYESWSPGGAFEAGYSRL